MEFPQRKINLPEEFTVKIYKTLKKMIHCGWESVDKISRIISFPKAWDDRIVIKYHKYISELKRQKK